MQTSAENQADPVLARPPRDHLDSVIFSKMMMSLVPGIIYVFNHETQANEYSNQSIATLLDYSSSEIIEMGDALLPRVIHPEDLEGLSAYFSNLRHLRDGETSQFEYRVIARDGSHVWLRSNDRVFQRAADGSVLRHIGCASDVTVEKAKAQHLVEVNHLLEERIAERTRALADLNAQLEERIRIRTRELEDAFEELEQLTFTATHDLRVPVNNLCRLGLMLQEGANALEPEQAEQVAWINTCAQQLVSKIEGLVQVAQVRLDAGLSSEQIVLGDAVARALDRFRGAFDACGAHLQTEIPKDVTIRFSSAEFDNILGTLISNSLKYADPARPLQLTLRWCLNEGRPALTVTDNGSGFDPASDLDKVFGLFQRAHVEPPGSGTALYCARRMLQRRGGHIEATAERGRGASFTMIFSNKGAL